MAWSVEIVEAGKESGRANAMIAMSLRSTSIDLKEADVFRVLDDHVRVATCNKKDLFSYAKTRHGQAASWPCLWRHRHLLTDLLALTQGRLLRSHKFESQVAAWLGKTRLAT